MVGKSEIRFLDRSTPPHIFTLICLVGLTSLTTNMFLPSLPGMAEYFETPYTVMQLSVALYLFMNAGFQPIAGPLSDKYGRRPVMLWALFLFVLATIGCIFAQSAFSFLFFRMCQAVVVSATVVGRATVRDTVSADQAASKLGYITMGMAVAPMLAPAIGGILDQSFGWQSNFVVFTVLGLVLMLLAWADHGETKERSDLSVWQQFRQYPALFNSPRFWSYSLINAFSSGAYFAFLGGGPFVGRVIYDLPPAQLGFYFAAPSFGYILGNFIAGRFSTRFGMNRMMLTGCYLVFAGLAVTLALFYLGYGSKELFFFGAITCVGVGNGMTIPNASAGLISVRPNLTGAASGLGGSIMLGGGATLSAIAGTFLNESAGPYPLMWLMLLSSVIAVGLGIYTKRRSERVEGKLSA